MSNPEHTAKFVDTGRAQKKPFCETFDENKWQNQCLTGSIVALDTHNKGCVVPVCLLNACDTDQTHSQKYADQLGQVFSVWNPGGENHCSIAHADRWEATIGTK